LHYTHIASSQLSKIADLIALSTSSLEYILLSLVVMVVAKFSSLPRAAASSLSVLRVSGAESTNEVSSVLTYSSVASFSPWPLSVPPIYTSPRNLALPFQSNV
jgi:hypothetical protein